MVSYLLIGCTGDPTLAEARRLLARAEEHAAEAQSYCGDAHKQWQEARGVFQEEGPAGDVKDTLEDAKALAAKCRSPVDAGKDEYGKVRRMKVDKAYKDYAFAKQSLLRAVGGKQGRLSEATEAWLADLDQSEADTKTTLVELEERLAKIIENEKERIEAAEKIAEEHPEVLSTS